MTERAFPINIYTLKTHVCEAGRQYMEQENRGNIAIINQARKNVFIKVHNNRLHIAYLLDRTVQLHCSFGMGLTTDMKLAHRNLHIEATSQKALQDEVCSLFSIDGTEDHSEQYRSQLETILEILSL